MTETPLSRGFKDLEKNRTPSALRHYYKRLFRVWRKKQNGSEKAEEIGIDRQKDKSLRWKIARQQFSLITAG